MAFQIKRVTQNVSGNQLVEAFHLTEINEAETVDGIKVSIKGSQQVVFEENLINQKEQLFKQINDLQNKLIVIQDIISTIQPLKQPQKAESGPEVKDV